MKIKERATFVAILGFTFGVGFTAFSTLDRESVGWLPHFFSILGWTAFGYISGAIYNVMFDDE